MDTNMIISRRNKMYSKEAVSDTDTMYYNQEMKENYDKQFLKAAYN